MKSSKIALAVSLLLSGLALPAMAESIGETKVDFRLRYEGVQQDNALKDADALTLRTRVTFKSKDYNGFSILLEGENTLALMDDYNDANGDGVGYSVVADPESTEMDQALIQYKNDSFTAKLGRQVITMDGHRHVGHVGWRQDRQTFDAFSLAFKPNKQVKFQYAYLDKRNRIFADEKDLDSKDHLFNASYKTAVGTFTGYGYLLEVDNGTENSMDTWGASFKGAKKIQGNKFIYNFEFASQNMETASVDYDAGYSLIEAGVVTSGLTLKAGYEILGSDGGMYGFSTPLATLHKFNGWGDQFLGTPAVGLEDAYASISGKAMGGKWALIYHSYSADEASETVDDLGSEINVVYSRAFGKTYSAGIKYSDYSAGDSAAGKVDTSKLWAWVGAKF